MEANKTSKKTLLWTTTLIIMLLVGAYFVYSSMTTPKTTVTEVANSSELNSKIFEELSKPKDYGAPISTDEAGYGRPNPFAPYK
jgi:hypothetical protein